MGDQSDPDASGHHQQPAMMGFLCRLSLCMHTGLVMHGVWCCSLQANKIKDRGAGRQGMDDAGDQLVDLTAPTTSQPPARLQGDGLGTGPP